MDWDPQLSVWFPFCPRSSLFCSFVQDLQQMPETAPPFCRKVNSSDRGEKQLWLAVQFSQQKQQKKSRQYLDAPKIQGKRKDLRVWPWILSFYSILSFQSFLDPINRPVMVLHYFTVTQLGHTFLQNPQMMSFPPQAVSSHSNHYHS